MTLVRFPPRPSGPSSSAHCAKLPASAQPAASLGNKLQILAGVSPADLCLVETLVDLILEQRDNDATQ